MPICVLSPLTPSQSDFRHRPIQDYSKALKRTTGAKLEALPPASFIYPAEKGKNAPAELDI